MTQSPKSSPLDWIMQDLYPASEMYDEPTGRLVADLLAYVELELLGEDADSRYPQIRPALEANDDFREEYESLRSLLFAERDDLLEIPPGEPLLDLTFIRESNSLWKHVESGTKQAVQLAYNLIVQLGQTVASFSQLPPTLTSQLVAIPVRDATSDTVAAEAVDIQTPETGMTIRLQLGPIVNQSATISLHLKDETAGSTAQRTRASLLDNDGQLLISTYLDTAGWVTFREVGVGNYIARITRGNRSWELPLTVGPPPE